MESLSPVTRRWFSARFGPPTDVQRLGWSVIQRGAHALLIAPTGSGKTLAAFLVCIDRFLTEPRALRDANRGVRVLYISPLKALAHDIERNLRGPLGELAEADEATRANLPRVAIRTGDSTSSERQRQLRDPPDILVTTPESLYLMLGSRARENLRSVETIILDEAHSLAPTKRGAHLALSLERLALITYRDAQRIGLSATAHPSAEVARFVGGDRPVEIVDTSAPPRLRLEIVVPFPDMTDPERDVPKEQRSATSDRGLWIAIYPRLLELIRSHQTTILFVNSRGLCERLTQRLNELAGEEIARSHHGSVSHHEREKIEHEMKEGRLAAIVATSSLELGIDMGNVDLVVLVESPGSVASGLQRIGRAGHGVGERSDGKIFPKHRGDLVEATVVAERMARGEIESLTLLHNPLDVLGQQIVAAVATDETDVGDLLAAVRRAANYRDLPTSAFHSVLDMLSGRFPSHQFADLRPSVIWDRATDRLTPRRGARLLALVNGGTIPDRGMFAVHLGDDGPRVGELDEEMVNETTPGQVFTLGASSWRVERVTRDRVVVSPAPGETGKLPFWRGDGPGRPIELGRAIGAFLRELTTQPTDARAAWLAERAPLDRYAVENLVAYVSDQIDATSTLPSDRTIVVERFLDEVGDWRICILSPFGARVHAPWGMLVEGALRARTGLEVQVLWNDDGIVFRFGDADELPDVSTLIPDPDDLEDRLLELLGGSPLFASQFRENAARALLLPRRRPDQRMPLWSQRLKSQNLLQVARQFPSFPVVVETYRSCLRDIFDLPALRDLLCEVAAGRTEVVQVETRTASPFARSLIFAYVAAWLYEADSPAAERKAQALTLDRQLLRELLGETERRDLLDLDVMEQFEAEIQGVHPDYLARHPDALVDRLRRVGDLNPTEIALRCDGPAEAWIAELLAQRRILPITVAGETRYVIVEEAALYRDALNLALPDGLPTALLAPEPDAFLRLVHRYGSTHAPFAAKDIARRFDVATSQVSPPLDLLVEKEAMRAGEFSRRKASEYCEAGVLRLLKRRTLARLRDEVAPVDDATLARFLPSWHGIGSTATGLGRLKEVLIQLEGMPISHAELLKNLLPARVRQFRPEQLDELGTSGWLVWVGQGRLGAKDGRVSLYRRERVAHLQEPVTFDPFDDDTPHAKIIDHLTRRGASFFTHFQVAFPTVLTEDLLDALHDLAWLGVVTNDSLLPLRSSGPLRGSAHQRARGIAKGAAGRWSLVAELLVDPPLPTVRAHARAMKLLERHGVVSKEVVALDPVVGGFQAIYPILREMEQTGHARRGHFVASLKGAQFASPGAIDRLRHAREIPVPPIASTLASTDPANPYGALVPWPEVAASDSVGRRATSPSQKERGRKGRRAAGGSVILANGEPLFLVGTGRQLISFPAANDATITVTRDAFGKLARSARGRVLRVDLIDGADPADSSLLEALLRIGFSAGYRGIEFEAPLDPP